LKLGKIDARRSKEPDGLVASIEHCALHADDALPRATERAASFAT